MAANRILLPATVGNPLTPGITPGGFALDHPKRRVLPVLVAPSTENQVNTVRPPFVPIACWTLGDIRFKLGSSFLRPGVAVETSQLAGLLQRHATSSQNPTAAIFGHAAPTGEDELSKQLSGRRAAAVYAMLARDVAIWERLFTQTLAEDAWGNDELRTMLTTVGHEGPSALSDFLTARGLPGVRDSDPSTRQALFSAYMDAICLDSHGSPFRIAKRDFLGGGLDPNGKGDFQGCGELNPALLFPKGEIGALPRPERDWINAPNRRIVLFLFPPGTQVPTNRWPCPAATEDSAGCKKRLFVDGESRRSPGSARREYGQTQDTFACRFYDRLARQSPCEGILHERVLELVLVSADGFPVPEIEFVVTFEGGSQRTGQLDRNGRALLKDPPNEAFRVEYKSHDDVRARSLAARLHDAILRQDIELIRGVLGQSSRLLQVIKSAYETYFNALGGNGFVADIRAAVADFPDDQHLIDHLLVASGIDNPTGATVIARREPDALPGDGVIV